VAMVMSTSSWICGRNLASSYRCPVPVGLRVGHDLGLRFPVLSAAPAGSSLIDSQVKRTRDLAVIFTAYECAS
jgi:hypothetical protein